MNLAFRSRRTTGRDIDTQIGTAFDIILNSVRMMWTRHGGDHLVFCFDGSSWRRDIYPGYKRKAIATTEKSQGDIDDDALFFEALNDFEEFLVNNTNATVLHHGKLEADDLISCWVDAHPDDEHVIVSNDTDYVQLLSNKNVSIYNPGNHTLYTQDGAFDDKGNRVAFSVMSNTRLKLGDVDNNFAPEEGWYKWHLFLKCVRGDTSDNIFPAYPGASLKGTSKRIGIRQAYDDRHTKGYNWNNFMLQRWTDADGQEHIVRDKIEENVKLIDLTRQPDEIRDLAFYTIAEALGRPPIRNVGIHFLRFCTRWDLVRIANKPTEYAQILNESYKGL
jgi:5'-3' exonuclease